MLAVNCEPTNNSGWSDFSSKTNCGLFLLNRHRNLCFEAQEGENICSQWMDIAAELLSVSDWWWGRRIVITIANCGDAFFVYREFSFLLALICFFQTKDGRMDFQWYHNSKSIKTLSQIKTRNRNCDTKSGSRDLIGPFVCFGLGYSVSNFPLHSEWLLEVGHN